VDLREPQLHALYGYGGYGLSGRPVDLGDAAAFIDRRSRTTPGPRIEARGVRIMTVVAGLLSTA
jgi:hypothetical protein